MVIKKGAKIPSVTFMYMSPDGPKKIDSREVFAGKRVALFGLPGAFTPVCSAAHLPGFIEKANALKAKGVDRIVCVSVNDPFVMDAWGKANNAGDKVMMLADNQGEFTRATGLAVELGDFGLGQRTQRFSMIVEDGTVKTINVEKSVLEHGISSAEAMLGQA